eukprot:Rhum_TRINITY_DN13386_c2_g1::Rhum_TRINITY_DN13386_c2_g1_i1::g.59692::m.59692
MEVMCWDELVADPLPLEVSAEATAAQVLRDACALFGREEDDAVLEVDGVVWAVDSGDESAGSLGLVADSTVVLRRSRARVLAVVKHWNSRTNIFAFPDWAWDDEVVVLAAVSRAGWALECASAALQDNEHVVSAAVEQFRYAIRYASFRLRDDETMALKAGLSGFLSPRLRDSEEFMLQLLKLQVPGCSLRHLECLRDNERVVSAAVEWHGGELVYASERLRNDEAVVLKAVRRHGEALEHASAALQDSKTVVGAAVKQTGAALKYASERLRWSF